MPKSLFRKEAVDAQREKLLGEASIVRPLPLWVFTLLAAGIAALVIAIGIWGQYTRRERVSGFLDSDAGAAQIMISDAGVISDLYAHEGDELAADAPIARVSVDRNSSSGSAPSSGAGVMRELAARRLLLDSQRDQTASLGATQLQQARKRIADLRGQIAEFDAEIVLQQQRLASAREVARRYQDLAREQFFSDVAARQKQDDVTDQEIKVQALRRGRAGVETDLAAALLEAPAVESRTRTRIEEIKAQISEVQQDAASQDVLRETLIRAPVAGTITNIVLTRGQTVAADTPLAMLMPKGSALHAELLVPTRAIGFVKPGQAVALRFDAFPYERFGQFGGTVTSVGRTVWSQGDRVGPLAVQEPVYRVVVRLEHQAVDIAGQAFALRAGMQLNADLLLETRSLLEWMFEPVLGLRERMR